MSPSPEITFYDVLRAEAEAITARRRAFAGLRKVDDAPSWDVTAVERRGSDGTPLRDGRGHIVGRLSSGRAVAGLALSGGGIRSAAFCLGVLQGLDAAVEGDAAPQVLQSIDYLSTVSGGGYIGASYAAGTRQEPGGLFPFVSKTDSAETIEVQHLRDYSSYLAPNGAADWVIGAAALLRGLAVNAVLVSGFVLLACACTALIDPSEASLGRSPVPGLGWIPVPFLWTLVLVGLSALVQVGLAVVPALGGPDPGRTIAARERVSRGLAVGLLACGATAAVELQSYVLRGIFDALHAAAEPSSFAPGWLGGALRALGLGTGAPWGALATAVVAVGGTGAKLIKVAQATVGDRRWSGFLAHWGARIAISAASLVVPVAVWTVYLSLCVPAIAWVGAPTDGDAPNLTPWAAWVGPGRLKVAYLAAGAALLGTCALLAPNVNALHRYYRDRLSRAFLWRREALLAAAREGGRPRMPTSDRIPLGDLAPAGPDGASGFAPYPLINAAVNLEGSRNLNRRGRNADAFLFSPRHVGSAATGYATTAAMQAADPELDLATAMAISGAAASADMGASTIRPLTLSLALLNVRLGYWLPNPGRVARGGAEPAGVVERLKRSWLRCFVDEALGLLDERHRLVYLTDGGHFDNLGLYELLRRRCRVIVAVDAEADAPMNFEALVRLQRCARIDFGLRIELPWEELRRWSRGVTVDDPHGPGDDPAACLGPHVALGLVDYGEGEPGVLIYVKCCITGDENDLIRDYRRRNPAFPHETTLDQLFTEEQFEAYRALGFHAAHSFFTGRDRFAFHPHMPAPGWKALLERALRRLDVPAAAIGAIVARQDGDPPWKARPGRD